MKSLKKISTIEIAFEQANLMIKKNLDTIQRVDSSLKKSPFRDEDEYKNENPQYCFGQKFIRTQPMAGKPEQAYIVQKYTGDYLIKMSAHFPFEDGVHTYFYVHIHQLRKVWIPAIVGIQSELFTHKDNSIRGMWRKKYITATLNSHAK
jgi:hypothetical protein